MYLHNLLVKSHQLNSQTNKLFVPSLIFLHLKIPSPWRPLTSRFHHFQIPWNLQLHHYSFSTFDPVKFKWRPCQRRGKHFWFWINKLHSCVWGIALFAYTWNNFLVVMYDFVFVDPNLPLKFGTLIMPMSIAKYFAHVIIEGI